MERLQQRASCKHLTHKYPAYLGCTLSEVCGLAAMIILLDLIAATGLTLCFGGFFLFFLGCFICSYGLFRLSASALGKLKANKPPGAFKHAVRDWLHRNAGLQSPFVTRRGHWSSRRRIG